MPEEPVMNLNNTYAGLWAVIFLAVAAYGIRRITRAIAAGRTVSSLEWTIFGAFFMGVGRALEPYGQYVTTVFPFPDISDPTCCRSMNVYFGETAWWLAGLAYIMGGSLLILALYKTLKGLARLLAGKIPTAGNGDIEHVLENPIVPEYNQGLAIRRAFVVPTFTAFFMGPALIGLGIMGLIQGKFTPPPFEWYYDLGKDGRETFFVSVGIYMALGAAAMLLSLAFWTKNRLPSLAGFFHGLGWGLLVLGTICLAVLTFFAIPGHIGLLEMAPAPPG